MAILPSFSEATMSSQSLTVETIRGLTVDITGAEREVTVEAVNAITLEVAAFDTTMANAIQIRGTAVSATAPSRGQSPTYNGTDYAPSAATLKASLFATLADAVSAARTLGVPLDCGDASYAVTAAVDISNVPI